MTARIHGENILVVISRYRPLAPDGHELLAHVALDIPALPLTGQLLLREVFEDGGEGILAPARGGELQFALVLGGVDTAGDELEPLPALLPGFLEGHGIAGTQLPRRRVFEARETLDHDVGLAAGLGDLDTKTADLVVHNEAAAVFSTGWIRCRTLQVFNGFCGEPFASNWHFCPRFRQHMDNIFAALRRCLMRRDNTRQYRLCKPYRYKSRRDELC